MTAELKKISAYDFDGTITNADSLPLFISHVFGKRRLIKELIVLSPQIVAMKMGLVDSGKVKERLFSHLFKGMPEEDFNRHCRDFAASASELVHPLARESIEGALAQGDTVVVVTASIENWVKPFFAGGRVQVIGTRVQVRHGCLTGRFDGPNCRGEEKVRRFHEIYPQESYSHLTYYGDSIGDRPMLQLADTPHYRPFTSSWQNH